MVWHKESAKSCAGFGENSVGWYRPYVGVELFSASFLHKCNSGRESDSGRQYQNSGIFKSGRL